MCPIGIGETLHRAIAKLVMRATEDQAKTACGRLQLCAGIEAGIEGKTHVVEQRRREQTVPVPYRRADEESADGCSTVANDAERVGGAVAARGVG